MQSSMDIRPILLCLVCVTALSRAAGAQTAASAGDLNDVSLPRYTIGGAIGTTVGDSGSVALVALQIPVSRHVVTEFEATRHAFDQSVNYRSAGAGYVVNETNQQDGRTAALYGNVLLRAGKPRFVGFMGGGVGYQTTHRHQSSVRVCAASGGATCPPGATAERHAEQKDAGVSGQVLGGVDVPLPNRLTPFAEVRLTLPEVGINVLAGLRYTLFAPAFSSPPLFRAGAARRNTAIRVHLTDGGQRTGRLTELSAQEIAFTDGGQPNVLPLSEVRNVERVSHAARNGAAIGALVGSVLLVSTASRDCDCPNTSGMPLLGAGIGLGIGAIINAATHDRRTVFRR